MKVDCIIVAYNPDIEFLNAEIVSLKDVINRIYVVNNSSYKLDGLEQAVNLQVIDLLKNGGIAKAQNVAVREILERGETDYILFFDQDSILPDNYLSEMLASIRKVNKDKVALYGPTIYNRANQENYKRSHLSELSTDGSYSIVSENISSGSLVPTHVFETVGLMEESLFLDFVDFEWCWRARSKGYDIVQLHDVTLNHQVGEKSLRVLGVNIIKCSPFRCQILWQSYGRLVRRSYVPAYWKKSMLVKLLIQSVVFPIAYKPHGQYLKFTVKGFCNGVINIFR